MNTHKLLLAITVFAQSADVSAFPSWIGMVAQGGSFLLVVVIVCYLYPKQAKEMRDDMNAREDKWRALVSSQQARADAREDKITAAFDRQTLMLTKSFGDAATRMETAVVNVCRGKEDKRSSM